MDNINVGGTDKDWEDYFIKLQLDNDFKKIVKDIDSKLLETRNQELSKKYNILQKSSKHLKDSNMGYWYHFWHSVNNGNKLLILAISSYLHAILPGKLKQHAARGVISMYEDMKKWPHLRRAMYEISLLYKK